MGCPRVLVFAALSSFALGAHVLTSCMAAQAPDLSRERIMTANRGDTEEIAEPPFSADEIRAVTRPFRTYLFRVEGQGKPAQLQRMRFADVDEVGCRIEHAVLDEDHTPLAPVQVHHSTWEELVAQTSYAKDVTVRREAEVEVPAGRYSAWVYTVTEPQGTATVVTRAYFAKALPGAPVLVEVERDGVLISRTELLAHDPGGIERRRPLSRERSAK